VRSRRFAWQLGAVVAVGLVARVAYVVLVADHIELGLDSVIYRLLSGQIAEHGRYVDPGALFNEGVVRPTASYPPLYPVFLAGVGRIFGATAFRFQLAGAVAGSITVLLTGLLGRRIAGDAVGVVAAAIVAVHPLLMASDASVMSETIYVPLVLGAVLVADRVGERRDRAPRFRGWVALGGLLGLAALTRGDAIFVAVLIVGSAAIMLRRHGRPALRFAAVALLAALVVVTPWLVRNERRIGEPTLATVSLAVVGGANCPSTYTTGPKLGAWDFTCIQSERQTELGELEWSRTVRGAGLSYAVHHLGRLPLVASVRVLRVWGLYHPLGQARVETAESRVWWWQVLGWAVYLALLGLAATGAVVLVRGRARVAPLLAVIAAVSLTALATYGNQRFRLIAEPVLAIAAAAAIVAGWRRRRRATEPVGAPAALSGARDAIPAPRAAVPARDEGPS
jgi:4-amino-4-deoxy-L-arabinose transferase-like glycosyltransferase